MTLADVLVAHATTYGLVATRFAGFVVASPFPGSYATPTARVGLVAVLSFAVTASSPAPPVHFDGHVAIAATTELIVGALIGLVFRFLLVAGDVIGAALAQATGLGVPSLINPATDVQDTTAARIVDLSAMLIALAVGAHRVVIACALESFRVIPPGADVDLAAGVLPITGVATDAIAVGLRLSMPLVALTIVAQVALALLARTAPSLQIFNAGLVVLVGAGLLAFIADQGNIVRGLSTHFASAGATIDRVLRAVARGSP